MFTTIKLNSVTLVKNYMVDNYGAVVHKDLGDERFVLYLPHINAYIYMELYSTNNIRCSFCNKDATSYMGDTYGFVLNIVSSGSPLTFFMGKDVFSIQNMIAHSFTDLSTGEKKAIYVGKKSTYSFDGKPVLLESHTELNPMTLKLPYPSTGNNTVLLTPLCFGNNATVFKSDSLFYMQSSDLNYNTTNAVITIGGKQYALFASTTINSNRKDIVYLIS